MKFYYYGVDGTGVDDDAEYERAFKNSFVKSLSRESRWRESGYERGPALLGRRTRPSGERAATAVAKWVVPDSDETRESQFVVLAGYSRGGAAVIHSCNLLKQKGISVDLLLLFDAVDRAAGVSDVMVVPNNVKQVFHARRHSDSKSRTTFGNCGIRLQPGSGGRRSMAYVQKFFHGTHGSIGGVPWQRDPSPKKTQAIMTCAVAPFIIPVLLASKAPLQYARDANPNLIHEWPARHLTTVTYDKDARVASEVNFWMLGNMHRSLQNAFMGYKFYGSRLP